MAHFAELDEETNKVIRVIVVNNNELIDDNGNESEQKGIDFCKSIFAQDNWHGGIWKQTSYNGKFRKNYAGVDFTYDPARDAFIPPQPFQSWKLNEETCQWDAPVAYPSDGKMYYWDELTTSWVEVV